MSAFDQADGFGGSDLPRLGEQVDPEAGDLVVMYQADDHPDVRCHLTLLNCILAYDHDKAPPFEMFYRDGRLVALRVNLDGYVVIPKSHVAYLATKPPE